MRTSRKLLRRQLRGSIFLVPLKRARVLKSRQLTRTSTPFPVLVHVNCRDFNIFSSHGLLSSGLVPQSVKQRRSNPKVVGSIPTLVRVFLCPCVGPVPSVRLTLTWFIWDRNLALHVTLHSLQLILFKI